MRRSALYAALLFGLLCAAAACSAPPAQEGRGRVDMESGEEEPARTRAKAAPKLVAAQFPRLSLDGVTLPATNETGAETAPEGEKDEEKAAPTGEQSVQTAPVRNLFAFEEDPAVVAERIRQQEEAARQAQEAAKKAEEARQKEQEELRLHPPPPQPPPIPFTFIGYLGPPEKRIGVFALQGGQLLLAKAGDTVQSRFKIVEVGYESAEVGFQGFTQTQRIPLIAGGK